MHPPRARLPAALAAAALLVAAGCDVLEPGWSRRLGLVMEGSPETSSLIAPDVVTRGTPFQVTARTFGSSSCTRPDGYELSALPTAVEIRLYDQSPSAGTACTADFGSFPRTITLQFDQAGTAEIRVVGRDGAGGQTPKTIRKTITVQ